MVNPTHRIQDIPKRQKLTIVPPEAQQQKSGVMIARANPSTK